MSEREFEVILWGATGFTGRLVAEYLAVQYDASLRWAMAGRSQARLEEVRAEIGAADVPLLLADSDDLESLERLARSARVICTTVGPYARYGENLVAACAAHGTDYCDLAGEVPWIRRMIDRYSEDAAASGARLVNCCGFDSVPSDMGTWYLQREAAERLQAPLVRISKRLRAASGGLSGGTYASLNGVLAEAATDPEVRRVLRDPYGLNPGGVPRGPHSADLAGVEFDEDFQAWASPFVMASINTRVVRRSHALAGLPWGEGFHYDEALLTGRGVSGWCKAWANALGLAVVTRSRPGGLVKRFVNRLQPAPGEGPSAAEREAGFFKFVMLGRSADGRELRGEVRGKRDPGYGATSRMLGEAAVCLARDDIPAAGGCLTPSTALGEPYFRRLTANAGLSFAVSDQAQR